MGELLINQLNERGGGLLQRFMAVVYYEEKTCSFWRKKNLFVSRPKTLTLTEEAIYTRAFVK